MSTSLIAGLKQVDTKAQRVMVALADRPTLDDYCSCLKLAQYEEREHHAHESQT